MYTLYFLAGTIVLFIVAGLLSNCSRTFETCWKILQPYRLCFGPPILSLLFFIDIYNLFFA